MSVIAAKSIRSNLRTVFRAVDASTLAAGMDWYTEAQEFIAAAATVYGKTPEQIAVATAHLSPRNPWNRNKRMVIELLETGATRGLGRSIRLATAALESDDPFSTLSGPKTTAFAHNLIGDYSHVTVDVWAYRAAVPSGNPDSKMTAREYRLIAQAYRDTAEFFAVSPAQFQAVVWCAVRGSAV